MIKKQLQKLSSNSGVYIFKDRAGKIIYVGKATSLKSRVSSYFSKKINQKTVRPIEQMIEQVVDIETIETETVLEALILEANLIKKHQPKYNIEGKDDKTFNYVFITKEKFPRVLIVRETDLKNNHQSLVSSRQKKSKLRPVNNFGNWKLEIGNYSVYGPYTSKNQIQIGLKIIRKIFPYHSRKEKSERGCLDFQIGLCPGPYEGAISEVDYKKNIRGIKMILGGKKKNLVRLLEKEMNKYAREEKFEKALEMRNKIFALKHIQEIALLSGDEKENSFKNLRIEAYDISNISGDYAVGSMVVFSGLESDKSQYRKFKIKTIEGSDDVGMMREVLLRRFNNDWKTPNLIILDGGKGHLNMGRKIIFELGLNIEIVGIAKGRTRKKLEIVGGSEVKNKEIKKILSDEKFLKKITDEAHRFAITYHRKIRETIDKN